MSDYEHRRTKTMLHTMLSDLETLRDALKNARLHHIAIDGGSEKGFAQMCCVREDKLDAIIGSYEGGGQHAEGKP